MTKLRRLEKEKRELVSENQMLIDSLTNQRDVLLTEIDKERAFAVNQGTQKIALMDALEREQEAHQDLANRHVNLMVDLAVANQEILTLKAKLYDLSVAGQ